MAQKMNFEDNLFYLNALMKAIKDGLVLEIDPELFLDKTVDDLFFIDSALARMYRLVRENSFMIRRAELFHDILRSKRMYLDVLDLVLKKKLAFSVHLEPFFPKLQSSLAEHSQDLKDIQAFLVSDSEQTGEATDIISETELKFLLAEEAGDGDA